jgi:DNA-binding NarL/FixJ family response regulator
MATGAPHTDTIRVLLVDDDQKTIQLYKNALDSTVDPLVSGAKFLLTFCTKCDDAIKSVIESIGADNPVSIAFIDVTMADGSDPYQAAGQIRALDPAIEIVFVAEEPDSELFEIARKSHPKEKLLFFQKPLSALEIQQIVIALGAKWQAEKRLRLSQDRLSELTIKLIETNQVLSVLAKHEKRNREESDMGIVLDISSKILPIIQSFRAKLTREEDLVELDVLSNYVKDLTTNLTQGAKIAAELSLTELRVACMVKHGLSSQKIADQLCVSLSTVKSHRKSIMKKLNIWNTSRSLKDFLDANMKIDPLNG